MNEFMGSWMEGAAIYAGGKRMKYFLGPVGHVIMTSASSPIAQRRLIRTPWT